MEFLNGEEGSSCELTRTNESSSSQISMPGVDPDHENEQQEEQSNVETPDTQKVLSESEWMKIQTEINERQRAREAARLELERVKNTAGFDSNMEAMAEFEDLIGENPKSITREQNIKAERLKRDQMFAAMANGGTGADDESPKSISREQTIKAKRLKRAKLFAAMVRGGFDPPRSGIAGSSADETENLAGQETGGSPVPSFVADNSERIHKSDEEKLPVDKDKRRSKRKYRSRPRWDDDLKEGEIVEGLSVEPPARSGASGSGARTGNLAVQERKGSSVPFDADYSDGIQNSEEKVSFGKDEWRSKTGYGSRSRRHEEKEAEEKENHPSHLSRSRRYEELEKEENGENKNPRKRKSSDSSSLDRNRHKRRHSSIKAMDSTKRTRHDRHQQHSTTKQKRRHKYDVSSDEQHYSSRHRYRERSLFKKESRQHSRRRQKHYSTIDEENGRQRRRSRKHERRSKAWRKRNSKHRGAGGGDDNYEVGPVKSNRD